VGGGPTSHRFAGAPCLRRSPSRQDQF